MWQVRLGIVLQKYLKYNVTQGVVFVAEGRLVCECESSFLHQLVNQTESVAVDTV